MNIVLMSSAFFQPCSGLMDNMPSISRKLRRSDLESRLRINSRLRGAWEGDEGEGVRGGV